MTGGLFLELYFIFTDKQCMSCLLCTGNNPDLQQVKIKLYHIMFYGVHIANDGYIRTQSFIDERHWLHK